MNQGKKFVEISQEEYELLKNNKTNGEKILNAEKADFHRSDREMRMF